MSAPFCDRCGQPRRAPGLPGARAYEPPRYCPQCARRMVVQVTPTGLDGALQPHGELSRLSVDV